MRKVLQSWDDAVLGNIIVTFDWWTWSLIWPEGMGRKVLRRGVENGVNVNVVNY